MVATSKPGLGRVRPGTFYSSPRHIIQVLAEHDSCTDPHHWHHRQLSYWGVLNIGAKVSSPCPHLPCGEEGLGTRVYNGGAPQKLLILVASCLRLRESYLLGQKNGMLYEASLEPGCQGEPGSIEATRRLYLDHRSCCNKEHSSHGESVLLYTSSTSSLMVSQFRNVTRGKTFYFSTSFKEPSRNTSILLNILST